MASYPSPSTPYTGMGNFQFEVKDHVIGGKMVRVSATMSDEYKHLAMTDMQARDQIREHLIKQLVDYILDKGLCEINQMSDPSTMGTTVVARMYLAPNADIKVLRTHSR